jgi:purine-cytosine permease-like protein
LREAGVEKKYFFDKFDNVIKMLRVFWGLLFILLVLDLFISKHPIFPWEEWPEFYAVFGFVAYTIIVLIGKHILRPIVKREENYYD